MRRYISLWQARNSGTCSSTPGLVLTVLVLGLVVLLGPGTAGRVEGAPPVNPSLQNQLNSLQTTVNGINTKVDALQSQVDQLPPAWNQALPAAQRFELALGGVAVLDKETGLVWEQSPGANTHPWQFAQVHCNATATGGRKGWRLPTVQELQSLVDPNNPDGNPDLPPGHPFSNVQLSNYWSATPSAIFAPTAWIVSFDGGLGTELKDAPFLAWCVRSGSHGGTDAQ